jgi:hypothetical protein
MTQSVFDAHSRMSCSPLPPALTAPPLDEPAIDVVPPRDTLPPVLLVPPPLLVPPLDVAPA